MRNKNINTVQPMDTTRIIKSHHDRIILPNMEDYEQACSSFSWEDAMEDLDGLPNGNGLNIAYEAIDRHVTGVRRDHLAIRWLGKSGEVRDYTYTQLRGLTNHFANVLQALNIGSGERVFTLMPRLPELYITALGTFKNRSVFGAVLPSLDHGTIKTRLLSGEARVLVTTEPFYTRFITSIRDQLSSLEFVILVGVDHRHTNVEGTLDFHNLVYEAGGQFTIAPTSPEDTAYIQFTGRRAGRCKGAVHAHKSVLAHHVIGKLALDLHEGDVYWCTPDPGCRAGISYGIVAPLTNGVTMIVDECDFDVERSYGILQDQNVSVLYTVPESIRAMMKAGSAIAGEYDLSSLRFIAGTGDVLTPDEVMWTDKVFGSPFHDDWSQAESGGIVLGNYASMDVKPGSMGRPIPGIRAAIMRRLGDGSFEEVLEPGVQGELAVRQGWPSMFQDYLNEPVSYKRCFSGEWYLTGDLAKKDEDGYYWFEGRIKRN